MTDKATNEDTPLFIPFDVGDGAVTVTSVTASSNNQAPDADFVGYNFWLGKLNEFNGDYIRAEMVKAFIDSIEYRKRFGQ